MYSYFLTASLTSAASSVPVSRAAVVADAGSVHVVVEVVAAPTLVAVLDAVDNRLPRPAELLAELLCCGGRAGAGDVTEGAASGHAKQGSRLKQEYTARVMPLLLPLKQTSGYITTMEYETPSSCANIPAPCTHSSTAPDRERVPASKRISEKPAVSTPCSTSQKAPQCSPARSWTRTTGSPRPARVRPWSPPGTRGTRCPRGPLGRLPCNTRRGGRLVRLDSKKQDVTHGGGGGGRGAATGG